jgi:hypothetical protein
VASAVLCCATTRVGVRVLVRVRVTVGAQIESLQLTAARRWGIGVEGRGGASALRAAAGHLQSGAGVQHSPSARHSWGFEPLAPCLSLEGAGGWGFESLAPCLSCASTVLCCAVLWGWGRRWAQAQTQAQARARAGAWPEGQRPWRGCVVLCCAVPPRGLGLELGLGSRLDGAHIESLQFSTGGGGLD